MTRYVPGELMSRAKLNMRYLTDPDVIRQVDVAATYQHRSRESDETAA
jgi:hypothetical protein